MVNSFAVDLLVRVQTCEGFEHRATFIAANCPFCRVDLTMSLELVAIFAEFLRKKQEFNCEKPKITSEN